MALPQNVALRSVMSSGMVPRYRLVAWEEGVMWLGPSKIAADFHRRRPLHGDSGVLLAGERLAGVSLGRLRGAFSSEDQYAVLLRGQSCCSLQ